MTAARKAESQNVQRFVRDAIARSLLTLPFAFLDAKDPFGEVYGYYQQLLESSTSCPPPPVSLLAPIIERIGQDIATHEAAGNFLKADIERQWCVGLQLYFAEKV